MSDTPARIITDDEVAALVERDRRRWMPPGMEERERRTRKVLAAVERAHRALRSLDRQKVHVTDVTTSPEDHHRAVRMLSDIIAAATAELRRAGVIAPEGDGRQGSLFEERK